MYCGRQTRETFCLLNETATQGTKTQPTYLLFQSCSDFRDHTHIRSASKLHSFFSGVCPVPEQKHIGFYYHVCWENAERVTGEIQRHRTHALLVWVFFNNCEKT